jgi:hypothetical protein
MLASSVLLFPQDPVERNLLTGTISRQELSEILIRAGDWHPYPSIDEPEKWDQLPDFMRSAFILEGEKYLDYTWPVIPATAALDFVRSGNRTNYENVSFERRRALASLVMAELFERQGRFLDQVINGIWAICEETYWGISAHLGMQGKGSGLPDVKEPTIDLFAAETSCQLSWVLYLLGSRLDDASPLIRERIEYEINRRILIPGLERTDFWWMGYDDRSLNNWTPWICSNWMQTVLLMEKEFTKRTDAIYKIMTILDHFINPYPSDGGCDEGPGYWGHAGGSLYDCLDDLYSISGGNINLFNDPLIQNIGLYILRVYISYPYFVNFADASGIPGTEPFLIYRYGKSINSKDLMNFGAFLAIKEWSGPENLFYSFGALGRRQLPALLSLNEVLNYDGVEPIQPYNWLPDIQVMTTRSPDVSTDGLFLAAKGGHNDESHNHNDVGNFIIYLNGKPAIIDIGVETYRRQTFSDERYTIWTMQSAYHNLPTINGQMQKNGRQYEAENVDFVRDQNRTVFSMNLQKTYPEEAGMESYRRIIEFNEQKGISIKDLLLFAKSDNLLEMNMMTHFDVKESKPGQLILMNREIPDDQLILDYNKKVFNLKVEKIPVTDSRLKPVWGDELIRLVFTAGKVPRHFEYNFFISEKK